MAKDKKQSKYALKGQAYQYSANYRAWHRAKVDGNVEAAEAAAQDHERQFGYKRGRRKGEGL